MMWKSSGKGSYNDGNKISHNHKSNISSVKTRESTTYDRNYKGDPIYRRELSRERYDYSRTRHKDGEDRYHRDGVKEERYRDATTGYDRHRDSTNLGRYHKEEGTGDRYHKEAGRDERYRDGTSSHHRDVNTSTKIDRHRDTVPGGHRHRRDYPDYGSYSSDDDDLRDRRYDRTKLHHKQSKGSKRSNHRERDRRPRSLSPQTPLSESKSPMNTKYSPPPLPPFEPPSSAKVLGDGKPEQLPLSNAIPFSQFAESKRLDSKCKDNGPDPRLSEAFYGTRIVNKFDVVNINSSSIDKTLESPSFTLDMDWDSIQSVQSLFQTPLERINNHLAFIRPKIENEWWLKGTLSLLVIGIPRNWGAIEALTHLIESFIRYSSPTDTLSDEWESDEEHVGRILKRSNLREDCERLGVSRFILLFGEAGLAVNEIPLVYPRVAEKGTNINGRRFVQNEQPEAMGLLLFNNEELALKFWATLAATCIQAYPSTIRICPDPSGWRIYSEALSLYFQYDLLVDDPTETNGTNCFEEKENDATPSTSLDLLPVLSTSSALATANNTSISPSTAVPQKIQQKSLNFICSFISQQQDANHVAKTLSKLGVKCMYHKPSKIMSLQFPDDKIFQSISFCHKTYVAPSGSRVQCCFIKCNGKALPIIKRTNIEHLSNSMEKHKNNVQKPSKFKPPNVGIVHIDRL